MRAIVIADDPGGVHRAGRTHRALACMGTGGVSTVLSAEELARALRAEDGPAWLVRAGAWPVVESRFVPPPPSATGRPLCAVGAALVPGDACDRTHAGAREWHNILHASGGDLDRHVLHAAAGAVRPASVYLEAPLADALAERLASAPLYEALHDVLRASCARVVRWHAIDVADDPRLRVALVITSLQRGGAERVVLDLADMLPECGVYAGVVTTGRPTRAAFVPPPGTVDVSDAPGGRIGRMRAAAAAARGMHADVAHVHLLHAADLVPFRDARLPVMLTVHNMSPAWQTGLAELAAGDVALCVACSKAVETELRGAGIGVAVRTVWNGIDFGPHAPCAALDARARSMREAWGIAANAAVLLALANPRPQKRLHRLPGILRLVRERLAAAPAPRDAWLVVAGEAGDAMPEARAAEEQLRAEIAKHGVGRRVVCPGSVADVPALIAASDVLVSPSAWEGLSLAMLEALAGERPVVATDVGGAREVAERNPAVTLLDPGFTDEEAADAVVRVLGGGSRSGAVRDAARADFSRETMAARYADLYPRAARVQGAAPQAEGLWLVTNNFSTGGAQSSARRLLVELAARGHRVRAAVIQEETDNPTPGRRALQEAAIHVLPLQPPGSGDWGESVVQFLDALDRDPPRCVLMWNVVASFKLRLAELLLDTPLIDVSPGEMFFASLERWFESPRRGMTCRAPREYGARLAGVVVKYEGERRMAAELLGVPVRVIPNGVHVPLAYPVRRAAGSRLVLGTSARLSPQKKLEELFAALRLAGGRLPPCVLRIAGGVDGADDGYAQRLRDSAADLPVEWLGDVQDVGAFLGDLDLFVMISEPAGCPNASLEAMAAGLPVVATDHGGAAEQVVDGVTGRLVPRANAAMLADALVDACGDVDRLGRWGERSWARARELFSVQRMADDYQRVCFD